MASWKHILILSCLVAFSPFLMAQDCGCTNCPQSLEAGQTHQVCFEIVGAINDNLLDPSQGICGVELIFQHERIENLNMSLVSPAGQSVQLIGNANPIGLCGGSMQSANISFVPTAEIAMPMPGTSSTWDNDDYCAPGIDVEGSYYPFMGNLEDFNIGAVNGTWCLEIEALSIPPFSGDFIDLNILLCDPTGLNCCFADAGVIMETDTVLCETDPYLDYSNLMPSYAFNAPDEAVYAYTYVLSQNGIIQEYVDVVNLVDAEPGDYSICGLSYRIGDEAAFPMPNGVFTLDELRDALNSPNAPFCGEITDDCVEVEIVAPIPVTEMEESICEGDTLYIGELPFFLPGSYEINLQGYGCDSLITLDLSINENPLVTIDTTICIDEVILIGDSTYFEEGMYETVLPSSENCDSTVILNLSISNPETTSLTETICEGQCVMVGDSCFMEEGFHVVNFQTEANCDSIVTLFLIVQPINAEIEAPDSLGCGDDMIRLDGRGSDNNTNIMYQWFYENEAIVGANENTLMVSDTGMYSLEVFHSTSMCRDTATVNVFRNINPPTAVIDMPDTLTCDTNGVELVGLNSSGTGTLSYEWQTLTGNIEGATDLPTATATLPASYTLIVTDNNNSCSDTVDVEVMESVVLPEVDAGPMGLLTCEMTQDTLDGTGSSDEPFMDYLWVTDTGLIVQDEMTLMPIVGADGFYTLIVTNTETGCVDSASVLVQQDINVPQVMIAEPDTLNCANTSVTLDATASDSGASFTFEWQVITGNIVAPSETTLEAIADEPGIYELTITNTTTNCSQTAVVNVEEQIVPPIAIATVDSVLTCATTTVTLDASNSSGSHPLTYEWTDNNETFISDMVSITVSNADTFYLEVTDIVTQCESYDTIVVMIDTIAPMAEAGLGFEIDCITMESRLDGGASSLGLDYLWTGPGIVEDATTLSPLVNQAGQYDLTVTNPSNACSAIDSVEVTQNNNTPVVNIDDVATLTCIDTCLTLNANVSPINNDFVLEWTVTNGGNIKTGEEGLEPIINATGTYILTVTDTTNNCVAIDSVTVDENISMPIALAGLDGHLDCNNTTYLIGDAMSSEGDNISYVWTTEDGFIEPIDVNTLQINVDSAGTYVLQVINNDNGCQASDTVIITSSFETPNIVILDPEILDCSTTCVDLDATNTSSDNGSLAFQWSSTAGNIKTGSATPVANVDEAGLYELIAINLENGCADTSSVSVVQDPSVPVAVTQDTIPISCSTGIARLEGLGSSVGADYTYQWLEISLGANIITGENDIAAEADTTGVYMFIVTDIVRNCADSSIVVVTEDCTPIVSAFADVDTLYCNTAQPALHGVAPSGSNLSFEWFWVEGATVIDSTLDASISNGGTYIFTVTNNDFNTSASDTVNVVEGQIYPIIDLGEPQTLSCDTPCVTLGGNNTSQGEEFTYSWQTFDGNIVGADTLVTAKVDEPGLYDLEIMNIENGCTTVDATSVLIDETFIDICFLPPFEITCTSDTLVIDATCSTSSPTIEHLWTTSDGSIVSGTQNLTVRVTEPGVYYLRSTDTDNGCTAIDSVLITAQDCNLNASINSSDTLTCTVQEVTLSATVTPLGQDYQFSWTDSDNLEISDSLSVSVEAVGQYIFTANNLTTGEIAMDTVSVLLNDTPPIADAGSPSILDCNTEMATLDGSLSDQNTTVEWTSLGGHPINMANDFQATVIDTGIYQIMVTSLENGCTATDQVIIDENIETPIADAGDDQEIACNPSTAVLSGENSTLTQTSLFWQPIDGNSDDVCAGDDTTNPIVCSAGMYVLTVTSDINGCTAMDTVNVSSNSAAPAIGAGQDMLLDCATTIVSLAGEGPPIGEYQVEWRNLSNGQVFGVNDYSPEVEEAGFYELHVTSTLTGCDSMDVVQVRQDTLQPIADAGLMDTITCMDTNVELSGSVQPDGNYSYLWTSEDNHVIENATTLTPTIGASGNYTLIVTNTINSCQDSASVFIAQDENLPDVFAGNDDTLTCETMEITLLGEVPNAGDLDLTWQNSAGQVLSNNLTLNVSVADTFILTAVNSMNNCAFSDAIIITENTTPPTAIITASDNLLTCDMDSLNLSAIESSPTENLTYEWRRNNNPTVLGTDTIFTIQNPDTYHLSVTNLENGCSHDTSMVISQDENLPIVSIDEPLDLTCLIDTVVLIGNVEMVSNPTYIWTDENEVVLGNDLNLTVNNEGNYTLTVINQDNGCDNNAFTFVARNEDLPNVMATIVGNAALDCENTSVELSAQGSDTNGDFDYVWTNPSGETIAAFQFSIDIAGTYVLEVLNNNNGCAATDSVTVTADAALITGLSIAVEEQDCFGTGSATLFIDAVAGGSGPFYYSLNDDIFKAFPQFDYLNPGDYTLEVEDAFGCTRDTSFTIEQPSELLVELGEDRIIQLGETVDLSAEVNGDYSQVKWGNLDSLACPDCLIQTVLPLETTTYSIRVENENGCITEDQITIFVAKDRRVYLPNAFSPDADNANEAYMVFGGEDVEKIISFHIFDRWGNLVFGANDFLPNDPKHAWDGTLDGKPLNPAVFVYMIEIQYKDGYQEMRRGDISLIR